MLHGGPSECMARVFMVNTTRVCRGLGLRQGGKPHWTLGGLQTGRCRPSERTHSPWTPVTALGSWASVPAPLDRGWTSTDAAGHAAGSNQRAAYGPRNIQSRFKKAFKGHKNSRRSQAEPQQLCAGLACGLPKSFRQDATSPSVRRRAACTPSCESHRCPSKDA